MSNSDFVEILLVEDNPNDAELTLRALRKHHLSDSVHVVKDGAEAIDFVFSTGPYSRRRELDPRVILLDLKLPKVDGLDVLKKLKANEATKHIPIVVLTSSNEERDIVDSYKLGVNSYIVKPVEFDKFVRTVADLGMYWMLLNSFCWVSRQKLS